MEGVVLENIELNAEFESTFLPFRGGGPRFSNFALFTELLGFALEGKEVDLLLDFVSKNVLSNFHVQGLYLLKHIYEETWKVTQSNFAVNQELRLAPNHAIASAFESGAIGVASTNGRNLGLAEESPTLAAESYRLLLIPLIDNLVPRSVLVVVIGNSTIFSPADIELFSFLQAIISFVAYGSKPLDASNYDF